MLRKYNARPHDHSVGGRFVFLFGSFVGPAEQHVMRRIKKQGR
jgi:hypothetical protein